MLFPPIFILFIITLVWEYVKEGGDFVMFSRMVELMNSVREDTPRKAQLKSNKIFFEYKFGDRIFGVLIPIRKKLQWKAVGKKNWGFSILNPTQTIVGITPVASQSAIRAPISKNKNNGAIPEVIPLIKAA